MDQHFLSCNKSGIQNYAWTSMNHIYNLKLRETHSPAPIGKHKKNLSCWLHKFVRIQIHVGPTKPTPPSRMEGICHSLVTSVSGLPNPYNPWDERYISLHLVDFYGKCIGKYTVRPMDASSVNRTKWLQSSVAPCRDLLDTLDNQTSLSLLHTPGSSLCHVGGFPASKAH